jgi:hypothetical protein
MQVKSRYPKRLAAGLSPDNYQLRMLVIGAD